MLLLPQIEIATFVCVLRVEYGSVMVQKLRRSLRTGVYTVCSSDKADTSLYYVLAPNSLQVRFGSMVRLYARPVDDSKSARGA